jgi:hypothetical protein
MFSFCQLNIFIGHDNNIEQWCQGSYGIESELGMGDEAGWRVF